MAKHFSIIAGLMIISAVAFGQTTKPKLDQVKNDPKTTTNAAKADAQVVDKKNVFDQATLKAFSKRRLMHSKRRKNLQRKSS